MDLFQIDYIWFFLILLPFVSFMYSSVGHGGASGYLAMMTLFGFAPVVMKPTALLLNLFVAAIAFVHYWRAGHFNIKLFLSFAASSIPLAYIGGYTEVDGFYYKIILGVFLVFAILRMLNIIGKESQSTNETNIWQGLLVGGIIGYFSGLVGIGGGIILTPVILLMHWGNMKQAAAVSALFIWVNSAAGLLGQLNSGVALDSQAFILVGIAVTGGFLGSYFGIRQKNRLLRNMLAIVLGLACFKLVLF